MGQNKYSVFIVLGLFLGLFTGAALTAPFCTEWNDLLYGSIPSPLESAASTDPYNPVILYESSSIYDYYSASFSSYYYRTSYASSSYYYVIWLWAIEIGDNFNLYLYSNSGYSDLETYSTRSSGYLDYVVFRSGGQSYYPLVYRYSGSGYAYIGWFTAITVSLGDLYSGYLGSSICSEIYQVYLDSDKKYNFNLDVPSGGDFDLYIYYLDSGSATSYSGYYLSSANYGSGTDENIEFEPSSSATYAVLVVRSSGSGTYYFEVNRPGIDAAIITVIVIIVVFAVLALAIAIYNRLHRPPTAPPGVQRPPSIPIRAQVRPAESSRAVSHLTQTIPQTPPFIRCLSCGSANRSQSIFCRTCGAELEVQ